MKYILPLVLSLIFIACNDSNKSKNTKMSADSTSIEQAVTDVKQENVTQKPVLTVAKNEIIGEAVFNKCKSCHGDIADKHALGASQIIQGWEVSKIKNAIKGYQKGTYGGAMKHIMAAQAKGLSDEEIKKVAEYIHSL